MISFSLNTAVIRFYKKVVVLSGNIFQRLIYIKMIDVTVYFFTGGTN